MPPKQININPDQRELLTHEPENLLRDVEEKLKEPGEALTAIEKCDSMQGFIMGVTLVARGLVPENEEIDVLNAAISSLEEPYTNGYPIAGYMKLVREENDDTNRQILAQFKEATQDPEKRTQFISDTNEALSAGVTEAKKYAEEYYGKMQTLFSSWDITQGVPFTEKSLALLTEPEIRYLLKDSGLASVFGDDPPDELIIGADNNTEYGTAVARLFPRFEIDEESRIKTSFTFNRRTMEHELTHVGVQQLHNTTVYQTESGENRTLIYKGFVPHVFRMDGKKDINERYKIQIGSEQYEHGQYNLRHLDEASTALIHAVIECDGSLNGAERLFEQHQFGTFEPLKYTNWAKSLIPTVKRIGVHIFLKRYAEGDVEGLKKDLVKQGSSLENFCSGLKETRWS